ncbi:MAG TPA: hypothetical protein VFY80_02555, partial [Burkholderiales bacterium]|nr:hypothetical protein [Burkholderiales bacterium]
MAILSSIALASIRPEAFDEQIQHLRELAEMLQPDASVRSSASYFKALTALERMLLERNDVIGGLFSTTRPRGRAGILLEVSPIDLGREQRMLDHAVGMVDLPAARVIWYLDVLRELRATNLWWRTKILELALTRQQRPPQNMAAAMQAFERLTVESMLEMLPEQGDVPSVYRAPDARNHDIAMVRGFTAPRVLLNEEREQALMQALVPAPARTRARDAGGGDESQPTAAAPERSAVRTHEQSEAAA